MTDIIYNKSNEQIMEEKGLPKPYCPRCGYTRYCIKICPKCHIRMKLIKSVKINNDFK